MNFAKTIYTIILKLGRVIKGKTVEILNLLSNPEYERAARDLNKKGWPRYLLSWDCPGWDEIFERFKEYQLIACEGKNLAGLGFTVPLFYEGELREIEDDLSALILKALAQDKQKISPNRLLALSAVVSEENKGKGASALILKAMKEKALEKKFKSVLLPTRPILKYKYPLIPIKEYAFWKNEQGEPFDPWTRLHSRLGGKIFKTSECCIEIKGSSLKWQEWTGLSLLSIGDYLIPGGLSPMRYDKTSDIGFYRMPCVWTEYPLAW